MCVIWQVNIKKMQEEKKKFFSIVKDAWTRNSDGCGVLWHSSKGCYINKFLGLKQLLKFLYKNVDKFKGLVLHFRQATSGLMDLRHVHMWAIDTATGRYVIAVNGIVNNVEDWRALLGLEVSVPIKGAFDSWVFIDFIKKYNDIDKLGALARLTRNKVYIYNVNTGKQHYLGDGWEETAWGRVSSSPWLFREYGGGFWWDEGVGNWILGRDGVWRLYSPSGDVIKENDKEEE